MIRIVLLSICIVLLIWRIIVLKRQSAAALYTGHDDKHRELKKSVSIYTGGLMVFIIALFYYLIKYDYLYLLIN